MNHNTAQVTEPLTPYIHPQGPDARFGPVLWLMGAVLAGVLLLAWWSTHRQNKMFEPRNSIDDDDDPPGAA